MLPTSGYFRSVNCPFFESGLCERPHCHFRHVKKDPSLTMRPRSTSAEDALSVGLSAAPDNAGKPDLLRLVSEAVLKMQREMEQGRHVQAKPLTPSVNPSLLPNKFSSSLIDSNSSIPVIPPILETPSPLPTVTPTPPLSSNKYLDSLTEDETPIVPKRVADSPSSSQYMFVLPKHTIYRKTPLTRVSKSNTPVLEYKPTPIAELKKMKEQQNQEPNKYGFTFKEQSVVDDLEYDPVSNFAAGYPNKKKKLITPYSPHPVKRLKLPKSDDENTRTSKRVRFSVDSDPVDISYSDFHDNISDHEAHFSDDDDDAASLTSSSLPESTDLKSVETSNENKIEASKTEVVKKVESNNAFDIINQILTESEKCKQAILDRTIHNKDAFVDKNAKSTTVKIETAEPTVQKEPLESKTVTELKDETPKIAISKIQLAVLSTDNNTLSKTASKSSSDSSKISNSKLDISKSDTVQKPHNKASRSSSGHSTKNSETKHHSSKEPSKSVVKTSNSASKDKQSRSSSHDKHSHSSSQEKRSRSVSQEIHSHSSSHDKHSRSSSHEKHSHSSSHDKPSHISSHNKHSSRDKSLHKSTSSSSQKGKSSKPDSHKSKSSSSHESKSVNKHENSKDKSARSSSESKIVNKHVKSSSSSHKTGKVRRSSSSSDKSTHTTKSIDSNSSEIKKHDKTKHPHENKTSKSPSKHDNKVSSSSRHTKHKDKKHTYKKRSSSSSEYDSESSFLDDDSLSESAPESDTSGYAKSKISKSDKHRHKNKVSKIPTKYSDRHSSSHRSRDVEDSFSDSSSDSDSSLHDEKKYSHTSSNKKRDGTQRGEENKVTKSPLKHANKHASLQFNTASPRRLKDDHKKKLTRKGSASDNDDDHLGSESSDAADHSSEVALPDVEVDTDLDEHDTYEECLRIFNEYMPTDNDESSRNKDVKSKHRSKKEEPVSSKHRVAYAASSSDTTTLSRTAKSGQVPTKVSASQAMYSRYNKIQKMLDEQTQAAVAANKPSAFLSSVSSTGPTKRRIAHVPNVSAIITATNTVKAIGTHPSEIGSGDQTVAQTNVKGVNRVAHIPRQLSTPRPTIPAEYGSKVPCNIRQRYLNIVIDECLKIYEDERDAFDRALAEESNAYQRSSNRSVYINVVVNNIKRIRSEVAGEVPITPVIREEDPTTSNDVTSPVSPVMKSPPQVKNPTKPNPRTVSHQAVLGGKKAANVSYSIHRHKTAKTTDDIAGHVLYRLLSPYLLTEQQLIENNYPQAHPIIHGEAVIPNFDMRKSTSSSSIDRICCRCGARYKVSSKGVYLNDEECVYHYGRSFKRRVSGTIEHRYTCCEGDLTSEGCCCAPCHVCDNVDMDCLSGYVATLPKTPPINGDYGVFALDCEMSYTLKGLELTRLTVIGANMKPIYETLVKPEGRVLDYNTKFSGITEEDMNGVRTTLRDVQAVLLSKFSSKTILIGHSLESDFKALKLIHGTVIDTSVVFPHRLGPPKKRALKTLMAEHLNKIIQNDVEGHDSQEDAVSCMELMMWKVKEDLKKLIR